MADKKYGGSFCLLEDGRLIHASLETEFDGTDKEGNTRYTETGNVQVSPAFNDEDRFDFKKADFFIKHFGGQLVWKQ